MLMPIMIMTIVLILLFVTEYSVKWHRSSSRLLSDFMSHKTLILTQSNTSDIQK